MLNESQRAMLRTHGTLAARLLFAALFLYTGVGIILTGIGATAAFYESIGIPLAGLAVWIVLAIKLLGGAALALGYRTDVAASVLILFVIGATLLVHLNHEDINLWKNLTIIGGLLYVLAYGPGEGWSFNRQQKTVFDASHTTNPLNSQMM